MIVMKLLFEVISNFESDFVSGVVCRCVSVFFNSPTDQPTNRLTYKKVFKCYVF